MNVATPPTWELAFVLPPPAGEYRERVSDIFDITSKLCRQAHSG